MNRLTVRHAAASMPECRALYVIGALIMTVTIMLLVHIWCCAIELTYSGSDTRRFSLSDVTDVIGLNVLVCVRALTAVHVCVCVFVDVTLQTVVASDIA